MKATTDAPKRKEKEVIYYNSREEFLRVKRGQMKETFSKIDPEQLRKFLNCEI